LTPSPVIATTSPFALKDSMMRSFCSGSMRANTDTLRTRSASSVSFSRSSSAPVSRSLPSMPAAAAIALAVGA
jgi:hypothetical protein